MGFGEDEIQVDHGSERVFRFGNDQVGVSYGTVSFPIGIGGHEDRLEVHLVEGTVPLLLGANYLQEKSSKVDFANNMMSFGPGDRKVSLEQAKSGHFLPINVFFVDSERHPE